MTVPFKKTTAVLGLMLAGLITVGAGCGANVDLNANVGAGANAGANANANGQMKEAREMTVDIGAQNGSGISGKALLIEQNDKTKVMINVGGTVSGDAHPAHIHLGACPNPGAVKWALSDVVEGRSATVVDAKFDDIVAAMPLAINIHKSGAEIGVYVACGDLLSANVKPLDPGAESMMSAQASVRPVATVTAKTTVTLKAVGKLSTSGTAMVSETNGRTMVSIRMNGGTSSAQRASIRSGACAAGGAVKYQLSDIVNGQSDTTINAPLAGVMASGQLSVGVQKVLLGVATDIACGNLPLWDAVKLDFKL